MSDIGVKLYGHGVMVSKVTVQSELIRAWETLDSLNATKIESWRKYSL